MIIILHKPHLLRNELNGRIDLLLLRCLRSTGKGLYLEVMGNKKLPLTSHCGMGMFTKMERYSGMCVLGDERSLVS